MVPFRDRRDAGLQLADQLTGYAGHDDVIVLGLPRGGVPVAAEVARVLNAPLDVFLVRKLGVPGHEELAFGALAEGGVRVVHDALVRTLRLPAAAVEDVAARQQLELNRHHRRYRGTRPIPVVRGRTVILVDDGLATGATMEAAVTALRERHPARIIVAVPVGARESVERLRQTADEVVCVATPDPFDAVGLWYRDFRPTTDEEVVDLLERSTPRTSHPRQSDKDADPLVALVRRHARPFPGPATTDEALLDQLGRARVVLIGEATHGTHEFYRERALLTRRLIEEKGFTAVAVEADWPDAYRVNRFVRGTGADVDAVDALADFRRFPAWMWRNADVLDFVGWLRAHNERQPESTRAGFYGLDLYSLHASMRAVIAYLDKADPDAATRARERYACFDRFGQSPHDYAYSAGLRLTATCERDVTAQLTELRQRAAELAARDGRIAPDEYFVAEQNARVVRTAEAYYRTMLGGHVASWNLRDRHMAETLHDLMTFLERSQPRPRVVVWAHNSHLGDARATDMGRAGELNVGQLVRERFGTDAVLVGFSSFTGTVTAAAYWDGPALRRHLRPALSGSYEQLFHDVGIPRFVLSTQTDPELAEALADPRLERAVGVIYAPATERQSHYFHASLPNQFDVVLHVDETRAVEPLESTAAWAAGEMAETFPSGL